ncbi:hypothetical protein ACHWQZ_G008804 [Mnemiopsis leidyi]
MCEWSKEDKHCQDGSDERNCDGIRDCVSGMFEMRRRITEKQMCSPPLGSYPLCVDGQDQLNCTEQTLWCQVKGYSTSLTHYALCDRYPVCDDNFDEICIEINPQCQVHKHQLCDGEKDCARGEDEDREECHVSKQTCVRRVNVGDRTRLLQIPLSWLGDGVLDCTDGLDEKVEHWKLCGTPYSRIKWQEPHTTCTDTFHHGPHYVDLPLLCDDRTRTLHPIERDVCVESRDSISVSDVRAEKFRNVLHIETCLPGISLASCQFFNKSLKSDGFGITYRAVRLPNQTVSCRYFYGEAYVYMSCLGKCSDATCPVRQLTSRSCSGLPGHVFTLSSDDTLTVAVASRGLYVNDIFPCDNGQCVTLDKVCNNVNDCGDRSDERNCSNLWHCVESGEDIVYSAVCDGVVHCRDSSDECNYLCSQRVVEDPRVRVAAWIIGVSATLLNLFVLSKNISNLITKKLKCTAKVVTALATWISLGDLMMGVYILGVVTADQILGCKELIQWRVSTTCSILGVLNAMSAQVSTTAMTVLSFYRMVVVVRRRPATINKPKRTIFLITVISALIIVVSSTFALYPILGDQDYFIYGLYYGENMPLFTGSVNKVKHIKVLEKYYGRLRKAVSWESIESLVRDMFTADYGGITPRVVANYGVSNVCLFKYFVTPMEDHKKFVISYLAYFVLCFIAITVNYVVIAAVYKTSSTRSAGNRTDDNNTKLQKKIAFMILTDFLCWGPFLIYAFLHYFEIVDANKTYATFSLVILPVNSVCNPIIYDDVWKKAFDKLVTVFREGSATKPSWMNSIQTIVSRSKATISILEPKLKVTSHGVTNSGTLPLQHEEELRESKL